MLRAGIVGSSGYTGGELARILSLHPEVEITVATSRNYAEKRLSQVYPHLAGIADIVCEDVQIADLVHRADIFFTAVPHQTAMAIVPELLKTAGKKVIDLSADFRIDDPVVYEAWYQPHTAQEYLAEAVYGLPEINRDKIAGARLVANPGCYPTSIILALAPLLKNGLIDLDTIVADSKSGTSGAGRGAQVGTLFCEVTDGFRAYKVGEHRHTPEIEQELAKLAGSQLTISFTPHLLPVSRGILSTIYGKLTRDVDQQEISDLFLSFYQDEQFVRICRPGNFPATQYVRGSNYCDIGCKVDTRTGRVVLVSVIDNLVKGAAGQAVQNMNVVCGFQESLGLETVPLFP